MSKDNTEFPSFLESSDVSVPLGKALKDARITASLSVEEVAKKLNLSIATIHDLENNLDEALETQKYPVIYLRGYLLNYAKLVSLKGLSLYAEYQTLNSAQKQKQTLKSSSLIIPRAKKRNKKWPILFFLLIATGACAYFFQVPLFNATGLKLKTSEPISGLTSESEFKQDLAKKILLQSSQSADTDNGQSNEDNNDTSFKKVIEVLPEVLKDEVNNSTQQKDVVKENSENVMLDSTVKPINNIIEEAEAAKESLAEITTTNGLSTLVVAESNISENEIVTDVETEAAVDGAPENLSLLFNGECWTEVFDATGERIAFGLYSKGRVLTLTGMAPFKLKLGDPSVVEIQYQDKIIEGEFTPGRSAQFSVPLS
jgi:cytoskeleton protein RodZ